MRRADAQTDGLFSYVSCEARVPADRPMAVALARSAAQLCLLRAAAAGLRWPLPAMLTEHGLEALLFVPLGGSKPGIRHKAEPDWAGIHRELRRPGVTLLLLWEEYRAIHSGGYDYSRWCELHRNWGGAAIADDAAGASGGRATVRRLRRA